MHVYECVRVHMNINMNVCMCMCVYIYIQGNQAESSPQLGNATAIDGRVPRVHLHRVLRSAISVVRGRSSVVGSGMVVCGAISVSAWGL
jgi:hypothetical protein